MNILMLKSNNITKQYLEYYGRGGVGIYRLSISHDEPFTRFLNSLMITLKRKDQMPYYVWFLTSNPDVRFLILWCNGYFKMDFSDVTSTVVKIGTLHSVTELMLTDWLLGDISCIYNINASLNSIISQNYSPSILFHQRSFGTSVLSQF